MDHVRLGTSGDSPLQASKWLQLQLLIDADEMRALFDALSPFYLFICGALTLPGSEELSKESFLEHYSTYLSLLKRSEVPDLAIYRKGFSPVMTKKKEPLYATRFEGGQQLIRIASPVIQLQAHNMDYSSDDGKFRSMVFGSTSIAWGIQFSYPQLIQEAATKNIKKIDLSPEFPNTELFQSLRKWVRVHTIPTPFIIGEKEVHVPLRLGRGCLPWINKHPQLMKKGLSVKV